MNKVVLKDLFKEIKNTKGKFISLLLITFIGVGFFVGIQATPPIMLASADATYKANNLSDIKIMSTLGLQEEDRQALLNLEEITKVELKYEYDLLADVDSQSLAYKVISYDSSDKLNKLNLVEGNLPKNSGEAVIVSDKWTEPAIKIGEKVILETGTDTEITDILKNNEIKIVGIVEQSTKIDTTAETTTIGTGTIDGYLYIPEDDFALEVYTSAFLQTKNELEYASYSDEYINYIDKVMDEIKPIAAKQENWRYQQLIDDANDKLDEAKKDYQDGLDKFNVEIAKAEAKLDQAQTDLNSGWNSYYAEKEAAYKKLDDAQQQINDGWEKYYDGLNQFNASKKQMQEQLDNVKQLVNQYGPAAEQYLLLQTGNTEEIALAQGKIIADKLANNEIDQQTALADTNYQYYIFIQTEENINSTDEITTDQLKTLQTQMNSFSDVVNPILLDATGNTAEQSMAMGKEVADKLANNEIDQNTAMLDSNYRYYLFNTSVDSLNNGIDQFVQAEQQLKDSKAQLESSQKTLDSNRAKADQEFASVLKKLQSGQNEIDKGRETLNQEREDGQKELDDALEKITDAEAEINKIEQATWYILDRDMYVKGYPDFGSAAIQMQTIANIFPLFFILVAALVCLTTMSRMVDENRQSLGTMKSLGYSNLTIMNKYLLYAFIASCLGAILGAIIGIQLFPSVIYYAWLNTAVLGKLVQVNQMPLILLASGLLIAVILLTTYFASRQSLKDNPATLLRPKAPKSGKKILLEKIPFVWKKLSFSNKVTARNIFRYKKRFLMIIIGIAGSTALLVVGFGLFDSLNYIQPSQYEKIIKYDATVIIDSKDDMTDVYNYLDTNNNINSYQSGLNETGSIVIDDKKYDMTFVVPDNLKEFTNYNSLLDANTSQPIDLNNEGVVITTNFASRHDLSVGDKIKIENNDLYSGETTIIGISENYINDYIYIDSSYYKKLLKVTPKDNAIFVKLANGDKEHIDTLFSDLSPYESVTNVRNFLWELDILDSVLGNLGIIIFVIIACSGLLAFVVLYNLGSVNIGERTREIATLKVLGFKAPEVNNYINKESYLLSFLGGLVGLVLGFFLHGYIMGALEDTSIVFPIVIYPQSYLIALVITIIFTVIVNFVMSLVLKTINMIESLKSVE